MELTGTCITERDGMIVIKLDNGYNIGVDPSACRWLERPEAAAPRLAEVLQDPALPGIAIISTGGTIASRIDYRTGAVTSQFNADDILRAIPRLAAIAHYRTHQVCNILSENMNPSIWQELAHGVYDAIKNGAEGVIVTHGTDTMAYSAAAISFMLDTPVPVIFVGSQRSADRPSSDNVMNALSSAAAATSPLGEVAVVMHGSPSDDWCAIHRAVRVRKMHTSRRDAFQSMGMPPIGRVGYPDLDVSLDMEARLRRTGEPLLQDRIEERCALLQFYPGMPPSLPDAFDGCRGLVIAGTGLGHVSTTWTPVLRGMIEDGATVVMTSQCMHGRVCDRVYDTGRDLLKIGVVEGEDMLPEVALVKLMWVLGQTRDQEEAAAMMRADLRGEIRRCSAHGL